MYTGRIMKKYPFFILLLALSSCSSVKTTGRSIASDPSTFEGTYRPAMKLSYCDIEEIVVKAGKKEIWLLDPNAKNKELVHLRNLDGKIFRETKEGGREGDVHTEERNFLDAAGTVTSRRKSCIGANDSCLDSAEEERSYQLMFKQDVPYMPGPQANLVIFGSRNPLARKNEQKVLRPYWESGDDPVTCNYTLVK